MHKHDVNLSDTLLPSALTDGCLSPVDRPVSCPAVELEHIEADALTVSLPFVK